jgi:hypothetical protein
VLVSVGVTGYTASTFTPLLTSFKTAVAATLGRSATDIAVIKLTDVPATGRHLLSNNVVNVDFTVAAANSTDAAVLSTAITAPTALALLAANMVAQGIPVSATSLVITTQPSVTSYSSLPGSAAASMASSANKTVLVALMLAAATNAVWGSLF